MTIIQIFYIYILPFRYRINAYKSMNNSGRNNDNVSSNLTIRWNVCPVKIVDWKSEFYGFFYKLYK